MKIPIPFLPRMVVVRIEADPRRPFRFRRPGLRSSIGGLMLASALVSLIFALVARRLEDERQFLADEERHDFLMNGWKRNLVAKPILIEPR